MAFFALRLPRDCREEIASFLEPWRSQWPGAQWVHPEDFHLTLRFLGGLEAAALLQLQKAFAALPPPDAAVFSLSWKGAGSFRKGPRNAVLWIGLEEASPALLALQSAIESSVCALGFAAEPRPYRPHVTVARTGPREAELAAAWPQVKTARWGPAHCKRFELMKRRAGARESSGEPLYETHASYLLRDS